MVGNQQRGCNMLYRWETKFKTGDRVIWHYNSWVGTVSSVTIMIPSGEDMDYWEANAPRSPDGNLQAIWYDIEFDNEEDHSVFEDGISLYEE